MAKNVFVMGLEDFNLRELQTIQGAEDYRFHTLLDYEDIIHVEDYPIDEMLEKAERQLKSFSGSVDAIIGHWDFPVTTMVPLLCQKFGLPAAPLQSVVKCEHKYWSRVEQEKSIPECTPKFNKVNPFDDDPLANLTLDYPFWIKPVKSFGSQLGFKINKPEDFYENLEEIREHITKIGNPFNILLHHVDMPPEVSGVDGNYCIAEQLISGIELAPEGYMFHDEVHIHGVIDMVRENESFSRLEYPSTLPDHIQQRAIDAVKKYMTHIEYNNACFNVEFFWNKELDKLWMIEVNPRISQSHSNVFEKVDGTSNHEVAVSVALGERPRFEHGGGKYQRAAKFWVRRRENGIVTRVPSEDDIREVQKEIPDTLVYPDVEEGTRLSDLDDQDSYSYAYATIHMGAQSQEELLKNYDKCLDLLGFEFEDVGEPEGEAV